MSAKKKILYVQTSGVYILEFIPEVKIVGAATLNDMALDADTVLCF